MRIFLKLMGALIFIFVIIIGGLLLIKSHFFRLFEKHRPEFKEPVLSILEPLKNDTIKESLTVQKAGNVSLKVWAECYIGDIDLSIRDAKGVAVYHQDGRKLDFEDSQYFAAGEYILSLQFNRVFPAMAIMQITNKITQPAGYGLLPYLDRREYARVAPDAKKGFYWPYYLYVPQHIHRKQSKYLLVMPNNTGTCDDNLLLHENAAVQMLTGNSAGFAMGLGVPLLVPVFPRPRREGNIYTHALDRDSLLTTIPELKRLDLQLIAMIDDARERLKQQKLNCSEKVWMCGFSASGMFANRFTVLHPERVQAAAIGSPGGWPIVPVSNDHGQKLRYPIGVADVEQLAAKKFDLETFQKIPLYFYIGSLDTNDSVPFEDSYDAEDRPVINDCFGKTPVTRWPAAQRIYRNNHCAAQFVTYHLVGHEVTSKMTQDIIKFLRENQ